MPYKTIACAFWAMAVLGVTPMLADDDFVAKVVNNYISPNEEYPNDATAVFKSAPVGTYVTVGTERGFIGAASSPRVTDLFLVDFDPAVVLYNRVNTALIKASGSRKEYLKMRKTSSFKDWESSTLFKSLSEVEKNLLKEKFSAWVRLMESDLIFQQFHSAKPVGNKFAGVNYLHSDRLYKRIKKLADEDRIHTKLVDLRDAQEVEKLNFDLNKLENPISVLDLSNAWQRFHLGDKAFMFVVNTLGSRATDDTKLLLTDQTGDWGIKGRRTLVPWWYMSFDYRYIRQQPSLDELIATLHKAKGYRYKKGRLLMIRTGKKCGDFLRKAFGM